MSCSLRFSKLGNFAHRRSCSYFAVLLLNTARISGCHLVPPKNNVCEPEPENDFCDVWILSQSQFSSNNPRTTARGFRCEEHSSFILSWNLIGQRETKVITSQKSFPSSGSQTLFSAETSDSRKYFCVRRLSCVMMDNKDAWNYYHDKAREQVDLAIVMKTVESICSTLGFKLGQVIWMSCPSFLGPRFSF